MDQKRSNADNETTRIGARNELSEDFYQNYGNRNWEMQIPFNARPMEDDQNFCQAQYNPGTERRSTPFQNLYNNGLPHPYNRSWEQESPQCYQNRYDSDLDQIRLLSPSTSMFSRDRHTSVRSLNQNTSLQLDNEASDADTWCPMMIRTNSVQEKDDNAAAGLSNSNGINLSKSRRKRSNNYCMQDFSPMVQKPTQPAANTQFGPTRNEQIINPSASDYIGERNMRNTSNQEFFGDDSHSFVSRNIPNEEFFVKLGHQQTHLSEEQMPSTSLNNRSSDSAHLVKSSNLEKEPEKLTDFRKLRVLLMPQAYPNAKLKHSEKLDLEEAIIEEVAITRTNLAGSLRFTDIIFCPGYVEIHCANQGTVDWLMTHGAVLKAYKGCPVEPKLKAKRPHVDKRCYMSMFLFQTAGKSDDSILNFLKFGNNCNTKSWEIVIRTDQEMGSWVVISLDAATGLEILNNNNKIFYRNGEVKVRNLKKSLGLTRNTPKQDNKKRLESNLRLKVKKTRSRRRFKKKIKKMQVVKKLEIKSPHSPPIIDLIDLKSDND